MAGTPSITSRSCLICCAPHLAAHPCQSPSPGPALILARVPSFAVPCPDLATPVPAADAGTPLAVVAESDVGQWVPARAACLALICPGLATLVLAADAGPAAVAGSDAGPSRYPAEEAPARAYEHPRPPFAAVVGAGRVERLAGLATAGGRRVGPAGRFFPEALPAVPVAKAAVHFARAASDSAGALRRLAAGIGSAGFEAPAAVPRADIDSPNTVAGTQAAGPAGVPRGDPTCPIRYDAAPTNCPSAHPSAAVHPNAIRESTRGVAGNSAQERAG